MGKLQIILPYRIEVSVPTRRKRACQHPCFDGPYFGPKHPEPLRRCRQFIELNSKPLYAPGIPRDAFPARGIIAKTTVTAVAR